MDTCDIAVLGAGPYGLSVAAHLQSRSIDMRVVGEPMSFWDRHMPAGMLLRSPRVASHFSDPQRRFTLDAYEQARGSRFVVKLPPSVFDECAARDLARKVPLEDFVKYGHWFATQAGLQFDCRVVSRVGLASGRFDLVFQNGESVRAKRVVVAAGISTFTRIPEQFKNFPDALASHTSSHTDLSKFRDKEVLVIGAGQSALESAVLLSEAGAHVDVFIRGAAMRWLGIKRQWMHNRVMGPLLYGPADVGPAGVSLLVERPNLYRRLPRRLQDYWGKRSIRPAASCWVKARSANLRIHTSRCVVEAREHGHRVRIRSSDGVDLLFDHVLLGTGYRVDIARYPFLSAEVLQKIKRVDGFPVLDKSFESTLPGMHFVGAPAAWSFGPLMRFVAGATFSAPRLVQGILRLEERRREVTWVPDIKGQNARALP